MSLRRVYWRLTRPVSASVRVILTQNGQVLLVRHTYGQGWLLPGGGAKPGETLEQAARREIQEELGSAPEALRLEGIYTNFFEGKSDHIAVFSGEVQAVPGRKNLEIAEWRFFDPTALPAGTLPGHRRRIEEFMRRPAWPSTGEW